MSKATFTPAWKGYDMYDWDAICGVSPDLRRHTGKPIWNDNWVCVNPRVWGIGSGRLNWRIAIFTARTPEGRWSHSHDVQFVTCGIAGLPSRMANRSAFDTEDDAILAELRFCEGWVARQLKWYEGRQWASNAAMQQALNLIRTEIDRRSKPKAPVYVQLTLFDEP